MNVVNHMATGSLIALSIKEPALAIPLAFMSHYALDALPHFGNYGKGFTDLFKHRIFYLEEIIDVAALLVLLALLKGQPLRVYAAGIVAVSPDLVWLYRYWWFERKGRMPPGGWLTKFHKWVQWCERLWGIGIEVIVTTVLLTIIYRVTR